MNIFDHYLKKFNDLVSVNLDKLNLDKSISLDGVVIEIPPQEFDFDLSTNIALVLGKKSKQAPNKFATIFIELIKNNMKDFGSIEIAGPGFINFKFSNSTYQSIMKDILDTKSQYGSNNKKKKLITLNLYQPIQLVLCTSGIQGELYLAMFCQIF